VPMAVVATIGTTSMTSADPVDAIASICENHGIWLHVDAAYAGVTAMLPECRPHFAGWERADSIVLNPHKWLFVPFDLSAFYCRRMDTIRATFSLLPEYLRSSDGARNLMDTGVQLGRRFRALKLWMTLRHFGAAAIRELLTTHLHLARSFASWIDASPQFERLAPVPFSVVCFRARPAGWSDEQLDALNEHLLQAVNASGDVFLSHTRIGNRFALRLAIGHAATTERHVRRAWELLDAHAAELTAAQL
jgi:aromatic-L-amino-acid/L-tryptophan decarboxylase